MRRPLPLISNIGRHEAASLMHGDSFHVVLPACDMPVRMLR